MCANREPDDEDIIEEMERLTIQPRGHAPQQGPTWTRPDLVGRRPPGAGRPSGSLNTPMPTTQQEADAVLDVLQLLYDDGIFWRWTVRHQDQLIVSSRAFYGMFVRRLQQMMPQSAAAIRSHYQPETCEQTITRCLQTNGVTPQRSRSFYVRHFDVPSVERALRARNPRFTTKPYPTDRDRRQAARLTFARRYNRQHRAFATLLHLIHARRGMLVGCFDRNHPGDQVFYQVPSAVMRSLFLSLRGNVQNPWSLDRFMQTYQVPHVDFYQRQRSRNNWCLRSDSIFPALARFIR